MSKKSQTTIAISGVLETIWVQMGIDKPSNHDKIAYYCYNDIMETADQENWNDDDVRIALRRWMESYK